MPDDDLQGVRGAARTSVGCATMIDAIEWGSDLRVFHLDEVLHLAQVTAADEPLLELGLDRFLLQPRNPITISHSHILRIAG